MCSYHFAPAQVSIQPVVPVKVQKRLIRRGPHEERWVGWRGGWELLKRPAITDSSPEALTEGPLRGQEKSGDETTGVVAVLQASDSEAQGERSTDIGVDLDRLHS